MHEPVIFQPLPSEALAPPPITVEDQKKAAYSRPRAWTFVLPPLDGLYEISATNIGDKPLLVGRDDVWEFEAESITVYPFPTIESHEILRVPVLLAPQETETLRWGLKFKEGAESGQIRFWMDKPELKVELKKVEAPSEDTAAESVPE